MPNSKAHENYRLGRVYRPILENLNGGITPFIPSFPVDGGEVSTLPGLEKNKSDFDQFKFALPGAAVGTSPVWRHIFPARTGGDALIRQTFFFFVNEAADQTHIVFHGKHFGNGLKFYFTREYSSLANARANQAPYSRRQPEELHPKWPTLPPLF